MKNNILIVDDNEKNLVALESLLLEFDANIYKANNGNDALKIIEKKHICLILLDINMPGMDGFETSQKISSITNKTIPIIFLTAHYSDWENIYKGYESGAIDYLIKPYSSFILKSKVKIFLELHNKTTKINNLNETLNMKNYELKNSNENLKEEIIRRTEVENKLKNLIDTKNKFFSIIAHDLRSPLSSLLSLTSILVSEKSEFGIENNDVIGILNSIHKSSKNILSMFENLLVWSNTQTGVMRYEPKVYNLSSIINTEIEMFKDILKTKDINYKKAFSDDLQAYFDINMIKTVIRNLISNAIKFSNKKGTIKITLKEKNNTIYFSISDNGVGMSEKQISNLFKIENKLSTKGTLGELGTGLGLILAKEFIDQNNGLIEVKSKKEEGSSFSFTLPKN